jgi:hypothetical protein
MNSTTNAVNPQINYDRFDGWLTAEDRSPLRPGEKQYYSLDEFAEALFSEIDSRYEDKERGN